MFAKLLKFGTPNFIKTMVLTESNAARITPQNQPVGRVPRKTKVNFREIDFHLESLIMGCPAAVLDSAGNFFTPEGKFAAKMGRQEILECAENHFWIIERLKAFK